MDSDSWTELPLTEVLKKWTSKNSTLPVHTLSLAIHVGILIIVWCIVRWLMRFVRFTIVRSVRLILWYKWPIILLAIVAFIFIRLLNTF